MFQDASTLVTALCYNIKPGDEFISAKTSHLINSIIIKQNIQLPTDFLWKVVSWHVECLRKCSDIILPDILHNMQCILQSNPLAGHKVCMCIQSIILQKKKSPMFVSSEKHIKYKTYIELKTYFSLQNN